MPDDDQASADDQHQVELLMRAGTPGFTLVDQRRERAQLEHLWADIQLLFGKTTWVALVVLVAGLPHQASAQAKVTAATLAEPQMAYHYLTSAEGVTICYHGRSYSYLNISAGMSPLEEAEVRAHEAMHVVQHARVGGCEPFNLLYRSPKVMLESEAEAFHAGACVAIAGGMDSLDLEAKAVETIRIQYLGGGTPAYEIRAAYRRYPCPPS